MALQDKDSFFFWVINAGHGQQQAGKRSPQFYSNGTKTVLHEWWANFHTAQLLSKKLSEAQISHALINKHPDQVGQWLTGPLNRMTLANDLALNSRKPAIYVSIHYNSMGDGKDWMPAHGVEVLIPGMKESTDPHQVKCQWMGRDLTNLEWCKISRVLGEEFAVKITKVTGLHKRHASNGGTVIRTNLKELNTILVPAVMTENGFFDHKDEVKKIHDPAFREQVAEGHFQAIQMVEMAAKVDPDILWKDPGEEVAPILA